MVDLLAISLKQKAVPQTILLTGPSGVGKTTVARILKNELGCADVDYQEMNAAANNGVDVPRNLQNRMNQLPMAGPVRVFLFDECHQWSRQCQEAFLKILEEPPAHVYFILCTTDPKKLLNTIKTRCTSYALKSVPILDLEKLCKSVAKAEGIKLKVLDQLVELADGSPRKALVMLGQLAGMKSAEDQLTALEGGVTDKISIDLARVLLRRQVTWAAVSKILKTLNEEPEKTRRIVLGFGRTALLQGKGRGYLIIKAFEDHFYDSGKAGLAAACYEVINGEK